MCCWCLSNGKRWNECVVGACLIEKKWNECVVGACLIEKGGTSVLLVLV